MGVHSHFYSHSCGTIGTVAVCLTIYDDKAGK